MQRRACITGKARVVGAGRAHRESAQVHHVLDAAADVDRRPHDADPGTLTLGGTNTYSGSTTVNAGTLLFNTAVEWRGSYPRTVQFANGCRRVGLARVQPANTNAG